MAETDYVDGFTYPIKGADAQTCLKCHLDADSGTYPIGTSNRSWHTGLHFTTDKPVVAVADGEVVAYRFSQKTLEADLPNKTYSDSFVLLRHCYKSTLGNVLDFFSLYMHLDPKPTRNFLPLFLAQRGNIANGKESPAPGLILYKTDDNTKCLRLVPQFSLVTLTGEPFNESGAAYQPASYTDIDGTTYNGVFKKAAAYLKKTEDGKIYVNAKHHTHDTPPVKEAYGNTKGILIRSNKNPASEIVGFIPNGTLLEFEPVAGNSNFATLSDPIPSSIKNEPFYIKKYGQVVVDSSGNPDPRKLGVLITPATRPQVQGGDVLGGTGPFINSMSKKIVHVEIFTLQDLKAEDSILGDPKGERLFSNVKRYVIPAGSATFPAPVESVSLSIDDAAKVLEEPSDSQYVKLQITGLFRTVKYSWLDDHNQKELCDELTIRTYVYKLKTPTFDNLKKLFNNWIVLADKLYRVSAAQNNRKVFFPCRALSTAQVWVEKTAIGEKDDCGNVKIIKNVDAVFSCNPSLTSGTTGGTASTIDNPAIIKINDTQYARLSETSLVDLTGLEPQTPYSWGGFELLGEDPSNYDAFMDFANAKSQFIAKKGDLQETQTGKDLENAIKDSSGKYDIRAITDKKEWTDRLAKLIIKAPSEWHYSDDKYTTLTDNIGALNPEEIKKLIKSLAFWDELKGKDVFKESALTPPFSSDAVDGKEIWSFHPITFIQQMSLLMKAGLTPQQNLDFETLVSVIRAALGTNSTDSDGCKAIAVSFSNRLKKHEWIDSPNFQSLAARHQLKTQTPTEDEFNFITENVSRIFMDHKWSGLPDEYVLFHATSEALSSMPWDTGVLDIDNPKTVGSYKFYRYKPSARTFATVLIIKDIKLVNGGDKGVSLMCVPGAVVSSNDGSTVKPYRYDLKTPPRWDFEFRFNIDNCTPEMDDIKSTLKWELRYFHKNNDKYEEVKVAIAHTGYKFTVILPADISDYSVTLVPAVNDTDVLCDGFTIAIKKKEQLVFNGTTIKWLDENGGVVPFENGTNKINELNAFSGNSGKRAKEFQCVINEGPIPEGSWWVPRNNIRSYDKVNWWGRLTDTSWEGGENRWGKLRLLLEPALNTDTKNRSGFYICGSNSQASHGNIHLDAQMIVFANSFLARVESNGRLLLCVDYSKPRFVPPSKHLPWEIKERTVRLIAGSESGSHPYTACNYDGEFEGKFNPKDVRYSKFSDHPRHVGLSFGLIQFTQEGSLGELIALMNTRDPQLFKQIFGVHSEELLEVTSRKGNALYVNEEIFDNNGVSLGEKSVKRQPSVQPIAGHELWNSFWSEKLIVAGKQEIFQQCQIELAVRSYMDNCLQEIVGKIISEKSLALAYDRSVNEGPGVGGRLIKKCAEGDEKCFWTNYIPTRSDKPDIHRRLTNIYNSQDFTWEAVHEVKA